MKPKANATRKTAALRIPFYTRRSTCSQLCYLILALVLVAIPLAGVRAEHATILTPLAAELVPLGTSLQAPPANPFHLPSFAAPAKSVLRAATAFTPEHSGSGRLQ